MGEGENRGDTDEDSRNDMRVVRGRSGCQRGAMRAVTGGEGNWWEGESGDGRHCDVELGENVCRGMVRGRTGMR